MTMKILIVDDDFLNRRLLQKIVVPYGEIDQAADGVEAMAAFTMSLEENDPYDLILLDIFMPTMDGLEVLKTIRSLEEINGINPHKGVKIIMVTTSTKTDHIMTAFRDGCESYLTKPITKQKVLDEMIKLKIITENS